jgi:hypothetical protein
LNPEEEEQPSAAEVVDDYEAEQETLLSNSTNTDDNEDNEDEHLADCPGDDTEFPQLEDTIRNASKGVTEGTDSEYWRCVVPHDLCSPAD